MCMRVTLVILLSLQLLLTLKLYSTFGLSWCVQLYSSGQFRFSSCTCIKDYQCSVFILLCDFNLMNQRCHDWATPLPFFWKCLWIYRSPLWTIFGWREEAERGSSLADWLYACTTNLSGLTHKEGGGRWTPSEPKFQMSRLFTWTRRNEFALWKWLMVHLFFAGRKTLL